MGVVWFGKPQPSSGGQGSELLAGLVRKRGELASRNGSIAQDPGLKQLLFTSRSKVRR